MATESETSPKVMAQTKSNIIQAILSATQDRRKRWVESGNELVANATYLDRLRKIHPKLKTVFGARIPKASEALQVLLPRLAVDRGLCKVTPEEGSTPQRGEQLKVTERLLNRFSKINGRWRYHKNAVKHMVLRGRGVRFTAVNEAGIIYSPTIPAEDFIMDSNHDDPADAGWMGHWEIIPRYQLLMEVGDDPRAQTIVRGMGAWTSGQGDDRHFTRRTIASRAADDQRVDCVRIARMYFRHGLFRYKDGVTSDSGGGDDSYRLGEASEPEMDEVDDTPRCFIVSDDYTLIQERSWEIPFHENPFDPFPYTLYDTPDSADELWPMSCLEAGTPYLKYINWLLTLMMGKSKVTMRLLLALSGDMTQRDKEKIFQGDDIDILSPGVKTGGKEINKFLQQFKWDNSDMGYALELLDRLEFLYARATGLSTSLYSGDIGRQMRSAEEANFVREMSQARTETIRASVMDAEGRNFQKESLAARYLYDRNAIASFLTLDDADRWGVLSQDGVGVNEIATLLQGALGVDAATAVAQAEQMVATKRPVSLAEWVFAADYKIETGTTLRENWDHARSVTGDLLNQPLAALMRFADRAPEVEPLVLDLVMAAMDVNQFPDEYKEPFKRAVDAAKIMAKQRLQAQQQQAQQAAMAEQGAAAGQQNIQAAELQLDAQQQAQEQAIDQQKVQIDGVKAQASLIQALRPMDRSKP